MATENHRHEPPHAVQSEGYERRDANIPALLKFALGLALLIAVTLVAMKWTFSIFDKLMPLGAPAAPFEQSRQLPPSPMIQAAPHMELKDYCAAQQKNVEGYAWVDQQQGTVRIPVDLAMNLILEKGLPIARRKRRLLKWSASKRFARSRNRSAEHAGSFVSVRPVRLSRGARCSRAQRLDVVVPDRLRTA